MQIQGIAAAMVVCAAVTLPQLAMAGTQDFTLVNKTGYEIGEVYLSPAKSADWEDDVLGQDVLPNGERVEISFSRDTNACIWDRKVVYTIDDTSAEWERFNLCEVSKIKIYYNAKTDTTTATYE